MGLFDALMGKKKNTGCAHCKTEDIELGFSKKFDGVKVFFCSKECSREYRKAKKKDAKKPTSMGSSMPW